MLLTHLLIDLTVNKTSTIPVIKITLVTIKITLVAQLGECGGGIYIRFIGNTFFHVWLGCGRGSNTRVELIASWALLFFANFKRITLL